VAIRKLQAERSIRTAMVVDCDVHHGNGTASIFASDATVFTISLHQLNNYPNEKPPSNIDVDLPDRTADREYLAALDDALNRAFEAFHPNLLMYVAGADPYREDQLGGLALTAGGLKQRDTTDTVTIHCTTAKAACEALSPEHGGA
jgi:acetoin utilization deacetylase AcuC-like enzyme